MDDDGLTREDLTLPKTDHLKEKMEKFMKEYNDSDDRFMMTV